MTATVNPRLTDALADRYRIERELGQGGMATVYLAQDLRHDRHVAVKVVRPDFAAGMGSERFLREIRLAASLHHPNILPLYDSGEAGSFLYYVMPVAEGESLRDRLAPGTQLEVAEAVRLGAEVAGALDYAHRHGVVHRDIKPENILLHEGHALVTDFGIGKALSSAGGGAALTQTGLAVGTPAYMSPEQIGGDPGLDGRSDLYSLGCVLYEMLVGTPPFAAPTAAAIIARRFTEAAPDVTAARPTVPRALAEVVRRCLGREAGERYATGAQVAEALGGVVSGGALATVTSGAERARSRLPWIAVMPFVTRDPESADLAEGLAEDITTGLSRFSHLQVVGRQSVASVPAGTDIRRVGELLGARYLVEGGIRKSGNRVRVSAQLVDTMTGTHLWAENFDRDLGTTDLFALQDELTDRIVTIVADPFGVLVRAMAAPLRDRPIEEHTVSELVIRLWAYSYQVGPEEHALLRDGLEKALEREPDHADGWGALADLYWEEQLHGMNLRPDPLGRAMRAAQRAVELDPASQFGWAEVATVSYFQGDLPAFRAAAERAYHLNPRNSGFTGILAVLTAFGGDWDRGYEMMRRLMDLNPHHAGWFHFVPFHYHFRRGEYEQALAATKRVNMPHLPWTYTTLAMVAAELGRWDEAAAAVAEFRRRFPQGESLLDPGGSSNGWIRDRELEAAEGRSWRKAVAGPPAAAPTAAATQSIAVLPFANMSGTPDDEYFSDGISEEIINALAQLPGLRVAARTSAFSFKGKNEDLRTVGETLGVTTVLEGSVRRAANRLRITAQLINVADGYHLWSERFDREATDVFAIQDEIAGAIASKLQVTMGTGTVRARGTGTSLEAYDLLLKGRALLWQRGKAILDALPWLERAAALDPALVEAHALLGDAWRLKWLYGMAPAAETIPRARDAIARALALDAGNPQALAALANIEAVHDHLYEQSLATSARALARDPRFVQALCERAVWLSLGRQWPAERIAESLAHVRAARSIDPLSSWAAAIEVFVLLSLQRDEEAVRVGREALALDPGAFTARWALVWGLSALGRDDEALALARETLPMSGRNPRILTEMAALQVRRGEPGEVQEILDELTHRSTTGYVEYSVLGCVTAAAGRHAEARALVSRGIAEHEPYVEFSQSPAWAPFRADPEGQALLEAAGF